MGFLYLAVLLVSLSGMVVLDRRFRLFFFDVPARAAVVMIIGMAFFLVWDLCGISLGIFFRGETEFMTGVQIVEELPLEEVFFLALLCYLTMNVFAGANRLVQRRTTRSGAGHPESLEPGDPTAPSTGIDRSTEGGLA
jgi:lycopene cyclase domain-containing protein